MNSSFFTLHKYELLIKLKFRIGLTSEVGDMAKTSISQIVKQEAYRRGLSLQQVALAIRYTYPHFWKVINGKRQSRPLIEKLARFFDMPELIDIYEEFLEEQKEVKRRR